MSTETRAAVAEHAEDCRNNGAVRELWLAIGELRKEQQSMSQELAEQRGASKQQARNVTWIVAIAAVVQMGMAVWTHFGHR